MDSKSASSFVVAPRCRKRIPVKKKDDPVQVQGILKIHKLNLTQLGHQRTSTPAAPTRTRRLSEAFQKLNLSPVTPGVNGHQEGTFEQDKVVVQSSSSSKINPLGYPLLSSTKLDPSLDNDRLSNAVRLYRKQLEVKGIKGRGILEALEGQKEMVEQVTSHLFHKNAMVDTFEFEEEK